MTRMTREIDVLGLFTIVYPNTMPQKDLASLIQDLEATLRPVLHTREGRLAVVTIAARVSLRGGLSLAETLAQLRETYEAARAIKATYDIPWQDVEETVRQAYAD